MREIGNADAVWRWPPGMTSSRPIARRGQLGRDQQRHDSTRLHELEGPFEERDGRSGRLPNPDPSPPAVPIGETLPLLPRNLLGPKPRWIPDDKIEPTRREDVGEVALVVKPWQLAFLDERATSGSNSFEAPREVRRLSPGARGRGRLRWPKRSRALATRRHSVISSRILDSLTGKGLGRDARLHPLELTHQRSFGASVAR